MIHMTVSESSKAAKRYYTRDDYLSEAGESPGVWFGKGARRLGLAGLADRQSFSRLCDNLHPLTGEQLTPRVRLDRRPGFDICFSVPKSVSLLHALGGDERILDAFRHAVEETLKDLEQEARTRVRTRGQNSDRLVGNIVGAYFLHKTARPVDGVADPQLHAHAYTFNTVFDQVEGRWKALELVGIKTRAPYYEAAFHARLACALKELGYPIESTGKCFEIQGFPPELIEEFSKRRQVINAEADRLGVSGDLKVRAKLGVRTRESKSTALPLSQLRAIWQTRLSREERAVIAQLVTDAGPVSASITAIDQQRVRTRFSQPASDPAAQARALEFALRHCLERASAVTESTLLESALRFGVGSVHPRPLATALAERTGLIRSEIGGTTYITTHEIVQQERRLIHWATDSRGTCRPLIALVGRLDPDLSSEQVTAVRHILTCPDRLIGLCGKSGTGKSRTIRAVVNALEASGQRVMTFAPTAKAAREALRNEGLKATDTVASLLVSEVLQERCKGGVIFIDEAGLVSVPTMARLFELAEQLDCRLILSGDTMQHGPVTRGDSLRMLQEHGCLDMAMLTDIRRQSGMYKQAIEHLAQGRAFEGMRIIDQMGAIREEPSETRYSALANDYLSAIRGGESALIVSPTHAEIRKVTAAVRGLLTAEGRIRSEREIGVLNRLEFTESERGSANSYHGGAGWVLEFVKSAPGIRAGDRLEVVRVEERGVLVRDGDGGLRVLDPEPLAGRFEVFEPVALPVGVGEQIRITKNLRVGDDGSHRLHNGSIHTVAGFTRKGEIKLDNGVVLPGNAPLHIGYAYACTSHVAQGMTVDWVFIAQGSESIGAASMEQSYVSASRGRKGLRWYTDDRELLFDAVERSARRLSGIEVQNAANADSSIDRESEIEQARDRAHSKTRHRLGTLDRTSYHLHEHLRQQQLDDDGFRRAANW